MPIYHSLTIILSLMFFNMSVLADFSKDKIMNTIIAQIKLSHPNGSLIIDLYDTPASHQFLSQMPLTLNFSDYANSEKIAYLPKKLSINNIPNTLQQIGDFTYYAPWENLTIFYYDSTSHRDLYALGYIVSGKDQLVTITDDFTA